MGGYELNDDVLLLTPLEPSDAAEWLAGEDDEQIRWFEFPRGALLSDVQRFIGECEESWRAGGDVRHWAIRRIGSTPILGGVDLRRVGDGEVNLSYVVFPPHRRQGVARRASVLALRYAADVLGATTAVIKMLTGNEGSQRLARSLGAVCVGTTPSDSGATSMVYKLDLGAPTTPEPPGG